MVKLLREYIEDDQDFATFESILESLPDELEALFEHLLATVRKPARKRAYQIFALVSEFKTQHNQMLFLLSCIFLEDYEKDRQFAMGPMLQYSHVDWSALEVTAQKRLNGYCRGLAEVEELPFVGKYIAFTHRSVPEFLNRESVRRQMADHLAGFDLRDVIPQLLLARLHLIETASDHMFWAKFVAKLVEEDFETCAPFPYLSCLESTIVKKIGRIGTIEMESTRPLDRDGMVVLRDEFLKLSEDSRYGTFLVASPFYLSACFGKLDFVMWKIDLDPTLVNEEHKRSFLTICLRQELANHDVKERFQEMIGQRGHVVEDVSGSMPRLSLAGDKLEGTLKEMVA